MSSYSDTPKEVGENIKNILSEKQLFEMKKNGTIPPNEEFFTPEDDLDHDKTMLLNWIYPVGIILQFAEEVDPNALMPGQRWEKIEGKFLLASDSNYLLGATGGNKEHNHSLNPGFAKVSFGWEGEQNRLMMTVKSVTSYTTNTYNGASYWPDPTGTVYRGSNYLAAELGGSTGNTNNMPPYLVVNVWKRTA